MARRADKPKTVSRSERSAHFRRFRRISVGHSAAGTRIRRRLVFQCTEFYFARYFEVSWQDRRVPPPPRTTTSHSKTCRPVCPRRPIMLSRDQPPPTAVRPARIIRYCYSARETARKRSCAQIHASYTRTCWFDFFRRNRTQISGLSSRPYRLKTFKSALISHSGSHRLRSNVLVVFTCGFNERPLN